MEINKWFFKFWSYLSAAISYCFDCINYLSISDFKSVECGLNWIVWSFFGIECWGNYWLIGISVIWVYRSCYYWCNLFEWFYSDNNKASFKTMITNTKQNDWIMLFIMSELKYFCITPEWPQYRSGIFYILIHNPNIHTINI